MRRPALIAAAGALLWLAAAAPATDPVPPPVVTDSLGFRLAVPPYEFSFPIDHAAHPTFHTEWWYYTGHLRFGAERTFGYEATFFRVAVPIPGRPGSAWRANQMLFRHLALTDENGNFEIKNAPAGKFRIVYWHENGLRDGAKGRFGEPINIAGPTMEMKPTDFDVTPK